MFFDLDCYCGVVCDEAFLERPSLDRRNAYGFIAEGERDAVFLD
jgi:hypothetical protein